MNASTWLATLSRRVRSDLAPTRPVKAVLHVGQEGHARVPRPEGDQREHPVRGTAMLRGSSSSAHHETFATAGSAAPVWRRMNKACV